MAQPLVLTLNGTERTLTDLPVEPTMEDLVLSLGFRADRVALERNGEIVPRTAWKETPVQTSDRIELVHFVGGGCL